MRVSAKADYALRALIEMAASTDGKAISAEELGKRQQIPHGFLQAILADLRRTGIVLSQRGQSGGWRLAPALSHGAPGEHLARIDAHLSFLPLLVGIVVLVLAEAFRAGQALREENEAIV